MGRFAVKFMLQTRGIVTWAALVLSAPTMACDQLKPASVVMEQHAETCNEAPGALNDITEQFLSLFNQAEEDEMRNEGHYWQEWAFNTENTPIISSQLDKNVLGVGFWTPDEIEETELSYEEWLDNQGLQVSFAVGNKGKEPRVRVDYRWHDEHTPDVLFQVEVPF